MGLKIAKIQAHKILYIELVPKKITLWNEIKKVDLTSKKAVI